MDRKELLRTNEAGLEIRGKFVDGDSPNRNTSLTALQAEENEE